MKGGFLLLMSFLGGASGQPPSAAVEAELLLGIGEAQEGSFEEALHRLDHICQELSGAKGRERLLARAHLYSAVAHLGLERKDEARERFLQALSLDPKLTTPASEFPRSVRSFFDGVRAEAGRGGSPAVKDGKGSGRRRTLLLLGSAGVVAGGAAVAAAGRKDPLASDDDGDGVSEQAGDCNDADPAVHPNGRITVSPVESSMGGRTVSCTEIDRLTLTVSNQSCRPLSIVRITEVGAVTSGNCTVGSGLNLRPDVATVAPGSTARVIDNRSMGAAGCCRGTCRGSVCAFRNEYTVVTDAGTYSGGSYQYQVVFSGCPACSSSFGADVGRLSCPLDGLP